MKKLICLYLVTAISLALVACNENNESEPGNEGESTLHPDPPGSFETIDVNIPMSYDSAPTGTPVGEPTPTDIPLEETAPRTASPEGDEICIIPELHEFNTVDEVSSFIRTNETSERAESLLSNLLVPRSALPNFELSNVRVLDNIDDVSVEYTMTGYVNNRRLGEWENFMLSTMVYNMDSRELNADEMRRAVEYVVESGFKQLNTDGQLVYHRELILPTKNLLLSHEFVFFHNDKRVTVYLPPIDTMSVSDMVKYLDMVRVDIG